MSRRCSRGFLLLEATLTTLVLAIGLTALFTMLRVLVKSSVNAEKRSIEAHLAQRLLDEVRLRRWDERTPLSIKYTRNRSAIGTDGSENGNNKITFDDIDDFDGWDELGGPLDPLMRPISGYDGYSSSVTVNYLNTTTLAVTGTRTDFKRIGVCVWRAGRPSTCLYTISSNR